MLYEENDNFGKYLEDFKIGDVYQHRDKKTIIEKDNNLFCHITMNHHPLHLDAEYAKLTIYKKIIVAGTYVASIAVGLSVPDISGKAIANLDYEKITHDAPVFLDDTLHAETEILEVKESKTKPDRGIVFVETRAFNQNNQKVLTLRRHILIPKRGKK
ncbi:MAG: MaoC family dehydratase [Candidatus Cloacimonetes bacterium]|nr:MaoC family dehydratase [Candidatus Cloacimonadota bacterium]MBL7148605.1 MaoC family dehydratase [Candidatus Cloacimonadota bacterium]